MITYLSHLAFQLPSTDCRPIHQWLLPRLSVHFVKLVMRWSTMAASLYVKETLQKNLLVLFKSISGSPTKLLCYLNVPNTGTVDNLDLSKVAHTQYYLRKVEIIDKYRY